MIYLPEQLTIKDVFQLEEASIKQIQEALETGTITSVELTVMYLNRIFFYDRHGIRLNAIPLLYSEALTTAAEMDRLRSEGTILGPLHGIPFTVKDSYMVEKMTVAAGSPSFINLMSPKHSYAVERIVASGGILIGKTNMPPMACGGMQRGVYGRVESPYNRDYLTAAWASGSSNGSGTATAANFATFGMAEETVSSGRSPASNNGLVAYTPSRGLISIRGNWPLFPTKDVVVPHTKYVEDLMTLLDVLVQEDPDTSGDFWRIQNVVSLPKVHEVRPTTFQTLKNKESLKGIRLGVPKIYLGKSDTSSMYIRPSILTLWKRATEHLQQLGAEIIEIDFPLQEMYNLDPWRLKIFEEKGFLPENWMGIEWDIIVPMFKEIFLKNCNDENYPSWTEVNSKFTFPSPPETITILDITPSDDSRRATDIIYGQLNETVAKGFSKLESIKNLGYGLNGLEQIRKELFEDWLQQLELDGLVFPANSNIGSATTDVDLASHEEAMEQGNYFSNGNEMIRHLGIPTVSVCMGQMEDTDMPVNITFAGPAYEDSILISWAYAFEQATMYRQLPKRTPPLESTNDVLLPKSQIKKKLLPKPSIMYNLSGNILTLAETTSALQEEIVIKVFINGKTVAISHDINWKLKFDIAPFLDLDAFQKSYLDVIVLYQSEKQLSNAIHTKIPFQLVN